MVMHTYRYWRYSEASLMGSISLVAIIRLQLYNLAAPPTDSGRLAISGAVIRLLPVSMAMNIESHPHAHALGTEYEGQFP